MAGASESSASVVPTKKRRFSLLEEARTSRAPPQETRPEMTQGEKHMNRRRKNEFREALDAKREALARAANQPKPEPEWEPHET